MKKQVTLSIAAAANMWLDAESKTFTALCGESFSRREVINTALGTLALMGAAVAAGGVA